MKQLCIISDINADMYALKEFLNYIEENLKVDYIINLGNFIQGGPNPDQVFDVIMNDSRFINIMGNKEYQIAYGDYDERHWETGEITHEKWIVDKIGQERIKRLKELPLSKSLEVSCRKFFMMRSKREGINNYSPYQFLVKIIMDENESMDSLTEEERILIINEHDYHLVADNHLQGLEQFQNYTLVKPGAIGGLEMGDIKFAVINIEDGNESVSFNRMKYDISKVVKDCAENKVPENDYIRYSNKLPRDTYDDIYIYPKYAVDKVKMDWGFWKPLIKRLLENCKYIEFSCWESDENAIREITSNLDIIDKRVFGDDSEQLFYKVKNNDIAREILLNNYLCEGDKIKWFDVNLYTVSNDAYFYCEHYGNEMYLINAGKEDLDFLKSIINPMRVAIRA